MSLAAAVGAAGRGDQGQVGTQAGLGQGIADEPGFGAAVGGEATVKIGETRRLALGLAVPHEDQTLHTDKLSTHTVFLNALPPARKRGR